MSLRVVGVSGSLRDESYTRIAVERALRAAENAGAETSAIDLRTYDLPPLDPDRDSQGDGDRLRRRLREADAIVLGTPMYHGSYSGVLKNALDHCGFDEFEGKTVGLLGVAGGSFPITAIEHLRSVCRALNAWVLPHQAAIPNASYAIELAIAEDGTVEGAFLEEGLEERVATLGRRVVQYGRIEPEPATFESDQNRGAGD